MSAYERLLDQYTDLEEFQDEVDDLVYSMMGELNTGNLNVLDDENDQEDHIEATEQSASEINNQGLEAQIDWLSQHMSIETIKDHLDQARPIKP